MAVPFIPNAELYANHRKIFKSSQAYADMIWKRWTNEYLPQWNSRSEWFSKQEENISVGDLVWLVEDYMKRSHYRMGSNYRSLSRKSWLCEICSDQNSY